MMYSPGLYKGQGVVYDTGETVASPFAYKDTDVDQSDGVIRSDIIYKAVVQSSSDESKA